MRRRRRRWRRNVRSASARRIRAGEQKNGPCAPSVEERETRAARTERTSANAAVASFCLRLGLLADSRRLECEPVETFFAAQGHAVGEDCRPSSAQRSRARRGRDTYYGARKRDARAQTLWRERAGGRCRRESEGRDVSVPRTGLKAADRCAMAAPNSRCSRVEPWTANVRDEHRWVTHERNHAPPMARGRRGRRAATSREPTRRWRLREAKS